MQQLSQFAAGTHLSLLPAGITYPAALDALTGLLTVHAGGETASLFAAVQETSEGYAFLAPMGRVVRYDQLDIEGRTRLRAEIGRLASLLRRTAEEAARADPAVYGGLPALVAASLEVPSFEHVYAQAGRPVLAGWGLTLSSQPQGSGLLRPLDDGKPAQSRPGLPLLALGLGALGLALLGALGAAAVPVIFGVGERSCRIEEGDISALLRLQQERDHEQALRGQIADLQGQVAQRRAQCPLRPAPPVLEHPVRPAPEQPHPVAEPPPRSAPEPPPAPPREPPRPPQRPPDAASCNQETNSGGYGVTVTRHYLGPTRGRVTLRYDARAEPDRFEVLHRGRQLGSSDGFQSGQGGFSFDWNPPAGGSAEDYVVEVRVVGRPGSATTVWRYLLGCPGR